MNRKMPKRPNALKKKGRKASAVSGREPTRKERLNGALRKARDQWRRYEETLKGIETAADVDPAYVAIQLLDCADWHLPAAGAQRNTHTETTIVVM